ncbi:vanadium-dependent haloperoxidase [Panacibacter ginsenosidivorans]|uniref:Vanadium-dependent haloperoxidase n=1 Tax=Panacibacter ginsenosidivorans TaxID=1813871 RepID=A0A5B8V762_9BACT|nr:vanadium-dependent haloperoxidase [Panacibacter ginsenosidivorans]QEC67307.1 vanadium-dependent haloperoxidase [Panacibacter ginsenosidivorans]
MKQLIVILLLASNSLYAQKKIAYEDLMQPAVFSLSMVMLHDVVNPPAASRYYAYCTLGAYDIVSQNNNAIVAPSSFIKRYTPVVITTPKTSYDYHIAALYCVYESGRLLLPSGYMLEENEKTFIELLQKHKIKQSVIDSSVAVAKSVAAQIAAWSKQDDYGKLSTRLRYTPLKGDGYWFPTPPSYMEAVEPNWKTVKTLVIDSCNQFVPAPPEKFSKDSGTKFYALAREVYDVSKNPSQEQLNVAGFWDCNPFAVASEGHMMIGFKKISPGGHWMNITAIAAKKAKLDFDKTIQIHAIEAVTLMDAFISCWDEKYRSNRIRPETYINRYIDLKWQPLLQTPPFPEYTSGHSVVSTASAEVLTYLLGDNFSFTDNSEEMFELKPRTFSSFRKAAAEAAISRLYGGIHFRDAIESGQVEGKAIGKFICEKINAAGIKPVIQ